MDPLDSPSRIEACIVNHETSPFAELALRSFAHRHRRPPADLNVSLTIVDNHSQDEGFGDLETAAAEFGVPIVRSRWPAREARCNTHGDVLRDFVLDHRETDMFLFLDADIIFDEPGTVWTMAEELRSAADLWAVQARDHRIETDVGAGESLNIWQGRPEDLWVAIGEPPDEPIVGRHKRRCHPFCTLVRNSDVFLSVAEVVGLSAAVTISQDEHVAGFADTLGMASLVLATHQLRYLLSAASVTHFGGVTHLPAATETEPKLRVCRRLLGRYRQTGREPDRKGPRR